MWKPVESPDYKSPILRQRTRFFVDESLGRAVSDLLKDLGYNSVYAVDVGLGGHDDAAVFAYAWREQRVLLTHDRDFMDNSKFPEHRNPGIVVIHGGGGDQESLEAGLIGVITGFTAGPFFWRGTKSVIDPHGNITVHSRHFENGAFGTTKFRRTRNGYEVWED